MSTIKNNFLLPRARVAPLVPCRLAVPVTDMAGGISLFSDNIAVFFAFVNTTQDYSWSFVTFFGEIETTFVCVRPRSGKPTEDSRPIPIYRKTSSTQFPASMVQYGARASRSSRTPMPHRQNALTVRKTAYTTNHRLSTICLTEFFMADKNI